MFTWRTLGPRGGPWCHVAQWGSRGGPCKARQVGCAAPRAVLLRLVERSCATWSRGAQRGVGVRNVESRCAPSGCARPHGSGAGSTIADRWPAEGPLIASTTANGPASSSRRRPASLSLASPPCRWSRPPVRRRPPCRCNGREVCSWQGGGRWGSEATVPAGSRRQGQGHGGRNRGAADATGSRRQGQGHGGRNRGAADATGSRRQGQGHGGRNRGAADATGSRRQGQGHGGRHRARRTRQGRGGGNKVAAARAGKLRPGRGAAAPGGLNAVGRHGRGAAAPGGLSTAGWRSVNGVAVDADGAGVRMADRRGDGRPRGGPVARLPLRTMRCGQEGCPLDGCHRARWSRRTSERTHPPAR